MEFSSPLVTIEVRLLKNIHNR